MHVTLIEKHRTHNTMTNAENQLIVDNLEMLEEITWQIKHVIVDVVQVRNEKDWEKILLQNKGTKNKTDIVE